MKKGNTRKAQPENPLERKNADGTWSFRNGEGQYVGEYPSRDTARTARTGKAPAPRKRTTAENNSAPTEETVATGTATDVSSEVAENAATAQAANNAPDDGAKQKESTRIMEETTQTTETAQAPVRSVEFTLDKVTKPGDARYKAATGNVRSMLIGKSYFGGNFPQKFVMSIPDGVDGAFVLGDPARLAKQAERDEKRKAREAAAGERAKKLQERAQKAQERAQKAVEQAKKLATKAGTLNAGDAAAAEARTEEAEGTAQA